MNERMRTIIDAANDEKAKIEEKAEERIDRVLQPDELPPGVIQLVKVYLAEKRKISVGDKMAGRHGNKGIVARIVPEEDMPFLPDGRPVDIVLNPLGVPSRMNVGRFSRRTLGGPASCSASTPRRRCSRAPTSARSACCSSLPALTWVHDALQLGGAPFSMTDDEVEAHARRTSGRRRNDDAHRVSCCRTRRSTISSGAASVREHEGRAIRACRDFVVARGARISWRAKQTEAADTSSRSTRPRPRTKSTRETERATYRGAASKELEKQVGDAGDDHPDDRRSCRRWRRAARIEERLRHRRGGDRADCGWRESRRAARSGCAMAGRARRSTRRSPSARSTC